MLETNSHNGAVRQLKENLKSLLDRFKSGTHKAPPVKWAHIPKWDGKKTRPIVIPTLSDRIALRVVKMYLEPLLEPELHKNLVDFLDDLVYWVKLINIEKGGDPDGNKRKYDLATTIYYQEGGSS